MCARKLLQNILKESCSFMHQKRLNTLVEVANVLIRGEKLTMSALGNGLSEVSGVSERHAIKRVSNFLSNRYLQVENYRIQKALMNTMLSRFNEISMIVDWTPAVKRCHYILRANLICKNSSIVLYQETYPEEQVNNTQIQNRFLKRLHKVIHNHVPRVLIITDAGFKGDWFKLIEKLGWFFCGRVRGETQIKLEGSEAWEKATSYAKNATAHIKTLGKGLLTKNNKHEMCMYTYKQSLKTLKKKSQRNNPNACTELKRHIRSYTEGWFIVTNLSKLNTNIKKTIIKHYKNRMKIEASNRMTKSTKFGFGLSDSMTKDIERIKILLLIEQIASFIAWLVGAYKELTGNSRLYCNGSMTEGRRLSLIKIGIRALKQKFYLSLKQISDLIIEFSSQEPFLC